MLACKLLPQGIISLLYSAAMISDLTPGKAKIHGEWEITLVRNVLVRSTAGAFNLEGMLSCFQEFQQKVPATPWASLADGSNWEMSSAKALRTIQDMRRWTFSHHCVCSAIVIPGQLRRNIHQRESGDFPDELVRYFSDMEAACVWLTAKGFPFAPADYPHQEFIARTRT